MDLITDLRKKIESHHEEAIRALEVLKGYLTSDSLPSANGTRKGKAKKGKGRRGKAGSYREQVLKAIKASWATVQQICQQTELGTPQVRGVINAPTLKGKIESREIGGKKEYRLKEV